MIGNMAVGKVSAMAVKISFLYQLQLVSYQLQKKSKQVLQTLSLSTGIIVHLFALALFVYRLRTRILLFANESLQRKLFSLQIVMIIIIIMSNPGDNQSANFIFLQ